MCTPTARVLLSRSAAEVQLPAAASPAMPLTAEIARPQSVRAERFPAVMTMSPVGARETETCSCAVRGSHPNISLQNVSQPTLSLRYSSTRNKYCTILGNAHSPSYVNAVEPLRNLHPATVLVMKGLWGKRRNFCEISGEEPQTIKRQWKISTAVSVCSDRREKTLT